MFDRLRYDPRRLAIAGGALLAVLLVGVIAAVALHTSGHSNAAAAGDRTSGASGPVPTSATPPGAASVIGVPSESPATDVAQWNAMPTITPATSPGYPAIPAATRRDATSYARAFAIELFTRDYIRATRAQLIAWAQYEDAPLRSPNYPQTDWTKVLVDSLTDLTWDDASDTPIPADGPWLALRSEQARDNVSDARVDLDPQWEQQIASGYQPPDPLATARDVTLTITRTTEIAGRRATARFAVSIALQLGTAQHGGGYGVAATNNYVLRQVS